MKQHVLLSLSYSMIFSLLIIMNMFACKSTMQSSTKKIDASSSSITTFILVRHAEKAKDGSKNPNLTTEGQQRAERLKQMLQKIGINHIYTTDYHRTRQTITPIAEFLNINIQTYQPHDKSILDELKTKQAGKTILIAGHSNTVPAMLNHLIGKEKYADLDESIYDNLFIVSHFGQQKTKVLNLKY